MADNINPENVKQARADATNIDRARTSADGVTTWPRLYLKLVKGTLDLTGIAGADGRLCPKHFQFSP
jgi:hypothetical protein